MMPSTNDYIIINYPNPRSIHVNAKSYKMKYNRF
jgi:hypothetical protein